MKARYHFKKLRLYIIPSLKKKQGKINSRIEQIPWRQYYVEKILLSISQLVTARNMNSSISEFCVSCVRN